jgi:hypothetical protein
VPFFTALRSRRFGAGLGEGCPRIAQKRVLVSLQRQTVIPTAIDYGLRHGAAGVQRIGGHDLALEVDEDKDFQRSLDLVSPFCLERSEGRAHLRGVV